MAQFYGLEVLCQAVTGLVAELSQARPQFCRRHKNFVERGAFTDGPMRLWYYIFCGGRVFNGSPTVETYITHIRDVALLPGERVTHVFSPSQGLTGEPPVDGQVLITTNQRIMAFSQEDGREQTYLVPVEELKGVVVKAGSRASGSLLQGLVLAVGGLFVYLIVAYWLTGRIDGPNVPIINIDVGAIMVLLAIVAGVLLIGKYYFVKEAGSVTFQGSNWVFTFPYKSDWAREQVYQVVNTVFVSRRSSDGYSPIREERPGRL